MRGGRRKVGYSVSGSELTEFVEANECVKSWLGQYEAGGVSWVRNARGLSSFFKWLNLTRNIELGPSEFLQLHRQKRRSDNPDDLHWALNLAMAFSRDNVDLRGKNEQYKYAYFFLPIKLFCDCYEAPLTNARAKYRKRGGRSFEEPECTSERIRRALSVVSQRDRAVLMTQLQSGQGIRQVLVDINRQADYVLGEIDRGSKRIRLDFPGRKGNDFKYFTFIGADAIQEIEKWRPIREEWLRKLGANRSDYLFITRKGKPVEETSFLCNLKQILQRHRLWTGPYSFRTHMLRKFFESEGSPSDRGISKAYVGFMMGHKNGNDVGNKMDAVGGVYDRAPHINPKVVENEYAKLEPYLNVFSGVHGEDNLEKQRLSGEALDLLNNPAVLRRLAELAGRGSF